MLISNQYVPTARDYYSMKASVGDREIWYQIFNLLEKIIDRGIINNDMIYITTDPAVFARVYIVSS